jgi:hypothetical protein
VVRSHGPEGATQTKGWPRETTVGQQCGRKRATRHGEGGEQVVGRGRRGDAGGGIEGLRSLSAACFASCGCRDLPSDWNAAISTATKSKQERKASRIAINTSDLLVSDKSRSCGAVAAVQGPAKITKAAVTLQAPPPSGHRPCVRWSRKCACLFRASDATH